MSSDGRQSAPCRTGQPARHSGPDLFGSLRSAIRRLAVLLVPVLVAACQVAPLYGRGGTVPGTVYVEPVETRVAQRVRNGLIEELGAPRRADLLRLSLDVTSSIDLTLTDLGSDRATAGVAVVTARYTLLDPDGLLIDDGREVTRAAFDAPLQEFARQRAIRDAENRAAREAATRIRLAIAPDLRGFAPDETGAVGSIASTDTGTRNNPAVGGGASLHGREPLSDTAMPR